VPESRLDKAERSFSCAEDILDKGHADFAVSRAYYGSFYVAEALLGSVGLQFRRHGAVLSHVATEFVRTGLIERRFHAHLINGFQLRQDADYRLDAVPRPETVAALIVEGRAFLAAARSVLL